MIPEKLKPGDEIRIISPATSLAVISPEVRAVAQKYLEALGLKISFSAHAEEKDMFNSSPIASRLEDLHQAFADPQVKGILTTLGGYNSNQLLRTIDYELVQRNPKVFCGFSDITALDIALYARAGLVSYVGPHFSSFGMSQGLDYTIEYFRKCLIDFGPYEVRPSPDWSDDPWYHNQEERRFIQNDGPVVINPGEAEGWLLGGNLCTLNLLQGTEYLPFLADSLLLVEDDDESKPLTFDRDLQSLIHQPGFRKVKGLLIGRFQKGSEMSLEKLVAIVKTKEELNRIPVAANFDFGHTTPQFTFPIGGKGVLSAESKQAHFTISEH